MDWTAMQHPRRPSPTAPEPRPPAVPGARVSARRKAVVDGIGRCMFSYAVTPGDGQQVANRCVCPRRPRTRPSARPRAANDSVDTAPGTRPAPGRRPTPSANGDDLKFVADAADPEAALAEAAEEEHAAWEQ